MELDDDIRKAFVDESKELGSELHGITVKLHEDLSQPDLYKEFSNIVDRIYGTASSFEMTEFAEYCYVLKNMTFKCSQIDHQRARTRILSMMDNFVQNLVALIKGINDSAEFEKVKHTLKIEKARAEKVEKEILQFYESEGFK